MRFSNPLKLSVLVDVYSLVPSIDQAAVASMPVRESVFALPAIVLMLSNEVSVDDSDPEKPSVVPMAKGRDSM